MKKQGPKSDVVKMEVPLQCGKRPYQRKNRRRASGTAEWHSRSRASQLLAKVIYEWPRPKGEFGKPKVEVPHADSR